EPDGPTIAVEWPRSTVRLTPLSTCTEEAPSPSRRETFFNSMTCAFNGLCSYMEGRVRSSEYGAAFMEYKVLRAFCSGVSGLAKILFLLTLTTLAMSKLAAADTFRIVGFGD